MTSIRPVLMHLAAALAGLAVFGSGYRIAQGFLSAAYSESVLLALAAGSASGAFAASRLAREPRWIASALALSPAVLVYLLVLYTESVPFREGRMEVAVGVLAHIAVVVVAGSAGCVAGILTSPPPPLPAVDD